jgi:glutathione S-transferase
MYILHIANKNYSSWSLRPWLLMRTLAIPFTEEMHPFHTGSNRDSFRAFAPNGRVPCLDDGDIKVWDSLAIVEYLAESHPQIWPKDRTALAFARSVCAEMHSGFQALRSACGMSCGHRIQLSAIPSELQIDIDRLNELWNQGLERFGGPFLTGKHFTAADAFFAPVAFRFQTYGLLATGQAREYFSLLLASEHMQEWYTSALRESWREPEHEREILASGTITADLRASVDTLQKI